MYKKIMAIVLEGRDPLELVIIKCAMEKFYGM
jgi:hypothetical protein